MSAIRVLPATLTLWAAVALADGNPVPAAGQPMRSVEGATPGPCSSRYCLWRFEELAPGRMCHSGSDCSFTVYGIATPDGLSTGADIDAGEDPSEARFLAPDLVAFTTRPVLHPAYDDDDGPDEGFDLRRVSVHRFRITSDGRALEEGSVLDAGVPHQLLGPSLPLPTTPPVLPPGELERLAGPARPGESVSAVFRECRQDACTTVLRRTRTENGDRLTDSLVLSRGAHVEVSPAQRFMDSPSITVEERSITLYQELGGSSLATRTVSLQRSDPTRLAMVDPKGLVVQFIEPYTILKLGKPGEGPWPQTATARAETEWHVRWGAQHWAGPADLTLSWQAVQSADRLELRAEVVDDVITTSAERPVHRDHLEVEVGGMRLALLLEADGRVTTRVWSRLKGLEKAAETDEPFEAKGHFRRTKKGYVVRWSAPLNILRTSAFEQFALPVVIAASDADRRNVQETLLGHAGQLVFWPEYPPKATAWSPEY